jgi:hypothetical protein
MYRTGEKYEVAEKYPNKVIGYRCEVAAKYPKLA